MKKILTIFCVLIMIGCGSRKVEKNDTKKEFKIESKEFENKNIVIQEEKNTKITDSSKSETDEMIIEPIDNTKPLLIDGKVIKNGKITKRKTSLKNYINTNTYVNEKSTDKTIKTIEKKEQTKENIKTKIVDKKQFDFIGQILNYWWLWLLIVLFILAYRKYKKYLLL